MAAAQAQPGLSRHDPERMRPAASPPESFPASPPASSSAPAAGMLRIDVPVARLGMSQPPVPVQISWLEHRPLRLHVLTPPARAPQVAAWLQDNGLPETEVEDHLAPRVVFARAPQAPRAWARVLGQCEVRRMDLHCTGTATLLLSQAMPRLDPSALEELPEGARCRPVLSPKEHLTHRQREVLAAAVALGYYEVPRTASVRDVAAAVGLSTGATSELLRRGEQVLVAGHFDRSGIHARAPLWVPGLDDAPSLLGPEQVRASPP